MRGAELRVVGAGLVEAQLAVDRQTDLSGVGVLLAIVFPPANGAQLQGTGRFEGSVPAAGTAKTECDRSAHTG